MSYPGATKTKFGRIAVAERMPLDRVHFAVTDEPLKEVLWEIPIPVLDQEDLFAQGINTAVLIPGAGATDALGSCVANASTAHLSQVLNTAGKEIARTGISAGATVNLSPADPIEDEEFAIVAYHLITDQTGDPGQEWPPTDCGSSGLFACQEFERLGLISSYRTAHDPQSLVSLLQKGSVIQGTPWFNAWMTPDSNGFVDGDGSRDALEVAIQSGVAGGHETCIFGVIQLAFLQPGVVDPAKTVLKVRNSWSGNWGGGGCFLLHLSTLAMLGNYADFKQFVVGP